MKLINKIKTCLVLVALLSLGGVTTSSAQVINLSFDGSDFLANTGSYGGDAVINNYGAVGNPSVTPGSPSPATGSTTAADLGYNSGNTGAVLKVGTIGGGQTLELGATGDAFTIDTFVYLNATPTSNTGGIFSDRPTSNNAGFNLTVTPTGQLSLQYNISNSSSSTVLVPTADALLTAGTWYNIAVTGTAGTAGNGLNFYVNGVNVYSAGFSTVLDDPTSTDSLTIGAASVKYDPLNGDLDNFQLYTSALSAGQIQTLAAVPEPSVFSLGAIGLLGLVFISRNLRSRLDV